MTEPKDDFEQFIAEMAEAHTLYPSDRVWAQVQQQLPAKKSWPALWACSIGLLLLTLFATYWLCVPLQTHKYPSATAASIHLPKKVNTFTHQQHFVTAKQQIIEIHQAQLASLDALTTSNTLWLSPSAYGVQSEALEMEILDTVSTLANTGETLLLSKGRQEKLVAVLDRAGYSSNQPLSGNWEIAEASMPNVSDKWQYEIHAAPSIGFRIADDELTSDNGSAKNGMVANSNAAIASKHKAMLGTEIGLGIQYKINKILSLKTGIQLNVQQADMGVAADPMLVKNATSLLHQQNDTSADNNRIYQLSIPVGIQVLAISGRHWALSAGASLQPTYTLGGTDAEVSETLGATALKSMTNTSVSGFKKWNINTSFDARFSYRIRSIQVYVGPQVRYQHFANTNNSTYLPKEAKVDYGCRVGIVAPL